MFHGTPRKHFHVVKGGTRTEAHNTAGHTGWIKGAFTINLMSVLVCSRDTETNKMPFSALIRQNRHRGLKMAAVTACVGVVLMMHAPGLSHQRRC